MSDRASLIRAGLQANLDQIDGLNVFAYVPDSWQPPSAWPYPGGTLYDETMSDGGDRQTWVVQVVVGTISSQAAQTLMDGFCEPSGPTSIKEAIEVQDGPNGQVTLDGAVADLRVVSCTGFTHYMVAGSMKAGGGADALGCQWTIEVWVNP